MPISSFWTVLTCELHSRMNFANVPVGPHLYSLLCKYSCRTTSLLTTLQVFLQDYISTHCFASVPVGPHLYSLRCKCSCKTTSLLAAFQVFLLDYISTCCSVLNQRFEIASVHARIGSSIIPLTSESKPLSATENDTFC